MSVRPLACPRRAELEARIEELIALLDLLDDDPDLEDTGDDEPSLGGLGLDGPAGIEHDLEEDLSDYEPLLGWSNPRVGWEACPAGWEPAIDDPESDFLDGFRGEGQRVARTLLRRHATASA